MQLTIREYRESDRKELENIILTAENFGEPFLDSEFQRINIYQTVPELGVTYVVEEAKTKSIVGYICLEFRWRSLYIQSLVTHQQYLREGIGTRLVKKAIAIGEKHPTINVVRVDTGDFMDYAQQFYLSCGFQICGFVAHDMSWFNHQVHFVYPLKEVDKE
ncbi:MAG: GNAT family N-acetyltransferase [Asgard group archaeon]|nr:GNAT family N-acetyltransferase [Asgard group archaeon]